MKQFLIFIGGFVTGILVTLFVLFIISIAFRSNYSEKNVQVQYIEVKGKNGNVTLHTGMYKDSVQILVGKPDEVNLQTAGRTSFENWGYKINNKYGLSKEFQISDLIINFIDGKLEGVQQD